MTAPGITKDVEAPHLTQPRISILTSATQVNEPDERWIAGYTFNPEGCANGGLFDPCAGGNRTVYPVPLSGHDAPVIKPFIVYTSLSTSTYSLADGRTIETLFKKVDAQLSIVTSYYLEQQLWNDSASLGNPKLADAAVTLDGGKTVTPNQALAELEDGIAACKSGGNMNIHMRCSMLSHILSTGSSAIRRVGNVYLTALDNVVIPGRGFPGTGPLTSTSKAVGQTEWMYASPEVQYRLGKVTHIPDDDATIERLKQAIDRRSNDITVYAERAATSTFDPYCCLLAIEVTRPFTV